MTRRNRFPCHMIMSGIAMSVSGKGVIW